MRSSGIVCDYSFVKGTLVRIYDTVIAKLITPGKYPSEFLSSPNYFDTLFASNRGCILVKYRSRSLDVTLKSKDIKQFLETNHPVESRDPKMLEMYYSQLTKKEIRMLYEKYRLDFDLFGFTPDYFIEFGRGY